jgi:hypothetical protein
MKGMRGVKLSALCLIPGDKWTSSMTAATLNSTFIDHLLKNLRHTVFWGSGRSHN